MPPVNIALRISLSFNLERLFIDISKTLQKKKKKKGESFFVTEVSTETAT